MITKESADEPSREHRRPTGVSDAVVAAAGKLSEALETTERARGHLYSFHQLTGSADAQLDDALSLLREAGQHALAEQLATELIGRNVLAGRWTFQVVEEYDDGYYRAFRDLDERVRGQLLQGRRHVYEAEMKERRRTRGRAAHRASPEGEGRQDNSDPGA